jgi:hypothetical protein
MAKSRPREEYGEGDRPRKDKEGRERIVHIEIADHRFAGGPTPSAQAYARAVEQWSRLSGAVIRVPVQDLVSEPDSPMPPDVDADAPSGRPEERRD